MKRILFLFISVLLLSAFAAPAAFAAAPDDMVPVYVQVPDDWEQPCLWAWDDAGTNAFEAWPGGEFEQDPDNDGWWYIYAPNWANNIIINANEGTVQTSGELKTDGNPYWVTVESADAATISYDKLTAGDAPEYVEKIAIHAKVPQAWESVNLWAWLDPDGTNAFEAWPGEAMEASDGGWFTADAPAWVNSIIINGGAEGIQTADLSIESKEVWVTVADDLTAEISYENPDLAVPQIKIHAKVPADWADPHLWAWLDPDGTNAFAAWPGEPFTQEGDWYVIEAPGFINSIIVNANEGTVQTGDAKGLETGKDLWIVVTDAENYQVAYEEITDAAEPAESEPVVADTEQSEPEVIDEPADNGGIPVIVIVLVIVAVLAAAAAGVVIVKKKK